MAEEKKVPVRKQFEPKAEPKVIEVEYLSPANTTISIGGHMVEFIGGKATVSPDVAKLLKDGKHVK